MPDGRFVSKSIAQNEELGGVSMLADYLFSRAIPHLDRDGRINANPVLLKAAVCPLRAEITEHTIPDLLNELAAAKLIRWYESCGKQVMEFPTFSVHQKGMKYEREAASRLPAYDSATCTELVRMRSGVGPDEVRPSLSEVEVKSKYSVTDVTGASADVDIPPESDLQRVMGLARKQGYECDRQDGSIASALLKKHKVEDVLRVVEGQSLLVRFNKIDGPPRMARIYSKANNVDARFWRWCEETYLAQQKRKLTGGTPGDVIFGRTG